MKSRDHHVTITPALDPRGNLFDPACPTRKLLDRIGTKWTSMAVKVLAEAHPGDIRFAELGRRMPGVSKKMLSQTLRDLERDGLVARHVEPTVPPQVHYALTNLGLSLEGPLANLRRWAETHMGKIDQAGLAYDADRQGTYEPAYRQLRAYVAPNEAPPTE